MATWEGFLLATGWFLLRFGVPILGTALVVIFFRWLDQRWQRQSLERRAGMGAQAVLPIVKCWAIKDCPEEKCQDCIAYQNQSKPCWQHFRAADGCLKQACIDCQVFRGAPVPVIGD